MKDVVDRGLIVFLAFLLSTLSHESEAFRRVAVKKGGVAVVKCQFPGEWIGIETGHSAGPKTSCTCLFLPCCSFLLSMHLAFFLQKAFEPK